MAMMMAALMDSLTTLQRFELVVVAMARVLPAPALMAPVLLAPVLL